jgi:hypothetical protein
MEGPDNGGRLGLPGVLLALGKRGRIAENIMASRIEVETIGEGEFRVRVIEDARESSHRVTLHPEHYNRLTGGKIEPQELVRRSFQFLLEREPKESILAQFDLQAIGHYFPEYERAIKRRL